MAQGCIAFELGLGACLSNGKMGHSGAFVVRVCAPKPMRRSREIGLLGQAPRISSDARLLPVGELDQVLGLAGFVGSLLVDTRSGRNVQHT